MIIMEENPCVDVGLHLALGLGGGGIPSCGGINKKRPRQQAAAPVQLHVLSPSRPKKERCWDDGDEEEACVPRHRHAGGALSRLNLSPPVTAEDEEDSVDKDPISVDSGDHGGGGGSTRKKLRLSKDQSALLEESFRQQSTLNPAQKQELAQRLSLRPRQVEVWFQNRRARTKLKQTEVDCEFLRKWCESLTDENRRLKSELQEMRSMRTGNHHPFFLHLHRSAAGATGSPAAMLCPSCERVATPDASSGSSRAVAAGSAVLSVAASSPKFYSCAAAVKDSSVACCK